MDEKIPPKFEVSMSPEQLNRILSVDKLTIICVYDCQCFDRTTKASQVYDIVNNGPIRAYTAVDFLKHIDFDPNCSHNKLKGFLDLYGKMFQPIFR